MGWNKSLPLQFSGSEHAVCHGARFIQFRGRGAPPTVGIVEIERVALSDSATVDAWHEVYERADRFERPFACPWFRGEIEVEFEPSLRTDSALFAGVVDGHVVCAGTLELPLLDNTHTANLGVFTDPPHRRRGYGSAMLAHLEALVRGRGRRTAYLEVNYPMGSAADGRGTVAPDFARARGYSFALGDIMRLLSLPVGDEHLTALAAGAAARHRAYRIECFRGPVPQAWVEDYIGLDAHVATDAPTGALEVEAGTTDLASFREFEERIARQNRVSYSAIALHGETVVGFTTVGVSRLDPSRGYQWGTLVAARHRGHRLGLALKVANLQQVQTSEPALRSIVTWNAADNKHMIAVNEDLGFVPVERFAEYEKRW